MNWLIENDLAELAHLMRGLAVRHMLGEVTRAEHTRQLSSLFEQYKQMDGAPNRTGTQQTIGSPYMAKTMLFCDTSPPYC